MQKVANGIMVYQHAYFQTRKIFTFAHVAHHTNELTLRSSDLARAQPLTESSDAKA